MLCLRMQRICLFDEYEAASISTTIHHRQQKSTANNGTGSRLSIRQPVQQLADDTIWALRLVVH